MRSKADETLVIVETLICPLQISHSKVNIRFHAKDNDLAQECPTLSDSGSTLAKVCSNLKSLRATDHGNYANRKRKCGKCKKTVLNPSDVLNSTKIYMKS